MILQSLVSYYEALSANDSVQRPGWSTVRVSYKIVLRDDGTIQNIVSLKTLKLRGKKEVLVPRELKAPEQVVRSSGIRANFLCDTAAYLLGYSRNDKKAAQKWQAARELHLGILEGVDSRFGKLLCRFFENHDPCDLENLKLSEEAAADLEKGALLTFVDEDDMYAIADREIQREWDKHYSGNEDAVRGCCLVTGREDEIAVLHNKIKGVPGTQSIGASLVSFNDPAYESYGKVGGQGLNSPVGRYAMYAYTTALNYLLNSEESSRQRTRLGEITLLWWTLDDDRELEEAWYDITAGTPEGTIADTMQKLQTASQVSMVDRLEKPFCILGISPNSARLSVRFFYRDTFGAFVRNVRAHYERLSIERPEFAKEYLPLGELLLETVSKNVRDREKSVSPLLAGSLYSAIINDMRYPEMLYEQILCRIRTEHDVNTGKAAIIKAYLLKNTTIGKEVLEVSLNEECKNRAYVLGRLFAELESAQFQANGYTGLKERYLTSAAATPGLVFPSMLQMATYHIAKLKKNEDKRKQAAGIAIENRIGALIDMLEGGAPFPVRFNNTEQGLFIEGYYQQVQKGFRDANENKRNKEVVE